MGKMENFDFFKPLSRNSLLLCKAMQKNDFLKDIESRLDSCQSGLLVGVLIHVKVTGNGLQHAYKHI